jgi:hypothetical protein
VSSTTYATLIGKFVNDSKTQVEKAWTWNALFTTITLTTSPGTSNYTLAGSGYAPRVKSVNDTTNKGILTNCSIEWILNQQQLSTVSNGAPSYYAFNGYDGTDMKVELFETPGGAYSIKFNLYAPQAKLSSDATVLTIPASEAVIMGAYARALVERGEDLGLVSSEAYNLFKGVLADDIAIEASLFDEYGVFEAV